MPTRVPEYVVSWEKRAGQTFLRLTSNVRRNGVKLYVQQPLSSGVPGRVLQQTKDLLVKRLTQLVNRRPKK